MATYRLHLSAPDLLESLEAVPPAKLRQAAHEAVRTALEERPIADARLEAALRALEAGRYGASAERERLQVLVDELDAEQWRLQDAVERGEAERASYDEAFMRARAANALWYLLDEDPGEAAFEALYETLAALDEDLERLRSIVTRALHA